MNTALIQLIVAVGLTAQTVDQGVRRADELLRAGAYREARAELSRVLENLDSTKPTPLLVTVLNNLAGIEADLENFRDAEKLYLRSLRAADSLGMPNASSRLSIQQNLLVVYLQAGWWRKAERLIENRAADFDAASAKQRLQFLDSTCNLRRARKHFEQAAACYQEAIEQAVSTAQHDSTGFLWNSMGVVWAEHRQMTRAMNAFERAVTAHESIGRGRHPVLITTLANLGAAYLAEGQMAKADPVLHRARKLAEQFLGPSHPALYRVLLLQAKLFDRMRRKVEAKQVRRRAEAISPINGRRDPSEFVIDIDDLRRR